MLRNGRRSRKSSTPFGARVIAAAGIVGIVVFVGAPAIQKSVTGSTAMLDAIDATERSTFYTGCNEARAAGAAPIHRGSPGYRAEMDGDGDGIACEDY